MSVSSSFYPCSQPTPSLSRSNPYISLPAELVDLLEYRADHLVSLDHAVGVFGEGCQSGLDAVPGRTWVRKCIRVVFIQTKNGLSAFTCRSMKSIAAAEVSSSTVSILLRVRGPVSLILPSAIGLMTPRGQNFYGMPDPADSRRAQAPPPRSGGKGCRRIRRSRSRLAGTRRGRLDGFYQTGRLRIGSFSAEAMVTSVG